MFLLENIVIYFLNLCFFSLEVGSLFALTLDLLNSCESFSGEQGRECVVLYSVLLHYRRVRYVYSSIVLTYLLERCVNFV